MLTRQSSKARQEDIEQLREPCPLTAGLSRRVAVSRLLALSGPKSQRRCMSAYGDKADANTAAYSFDL